MLYTGAQTLFHIIQDGYVVKFLAEAESQKSVLKIHKFAYRIDLQVAYG